MCTAYGCPGRQREKKKEQERRKLSGTGRLNLSRHHSRSGNEREAGDPLKKGTLFSGGKTEKREKLTAGGSKSGEGKVQDSDKRHYPTPGSSLKRPRVREDRGGRDEPPVQKTLTTGGAMSRRKKGSPPSLGGRVRRGKLRTRSELAHRSSAWG